MRLPEFKKYPAVFAVIPLVIGAFLGYQLTLLPVSNHNFTLIILQIFFFLLSAALYIKVDKKNTLLILTFFFAVLIFGFSRFQFIYNRFSEQNISARVNEYKDKDLVLYGVLTEQPEVRESNIRLLVKVDSAVFNDKTDRVEGIILAVIYRNRFKESFHVKLEYGDVLKLRGKLDELPHRRNPGEFDYGEYLRLHGVDASFSAFGYDNIGLNGKSGPSFFKKYLIYPVKDYSIKMIDKFVGGDEGEYLKGLTLGERSNISKEMRESFVNAGVAHIIAVSGLNVAYVIIIAGAFLLLIPVRRHYKIFILMGFLLYYMNLTGNVPSIVRATIMAIVFLVSRLFERKPISYNIISFSAIVILCIDPRQLFDAGFILSYSAILSIVYFYPKLRGLVSGMKFYKRLDDDRYLHKLIKGTFALFLGTLAAQIGTLPISAIMFKKISIVSLFTNLFAIPFSNIALAIGFLVIICSTFSFWLAEVFAGVVSYILHWLLVFIDFSSKLDFSFVETYGVDALLLLFYYLIIFLLFTSTKENFKARLVISILFAVNFYVYKSVFETENNVKLAYLDVGNSSSCLISSPDGYNVLVNAGSSAKNYFSAERNVIPYLKSQKVSVADLLLITSLNKDEFRNIIYFVNNYPVSKIVVPSYYKSLFENDYFKQYFAGKSIEYIDGSKIIKLPDEMRLYIFYFGNLFPCSSMYVQFLYGNQLFGFSDAKDVQEDYIYSRVGLTGPTEVLKVPVSGSFNYTSPEFIVRTNPQNIVISSSRSYKRLNSDIFVKSLQGIGINVLQIKETGAVIFETDGIKSERVEWR